MATFLPTALWAAQMAAATLGATWGAPGAGPVPPAGPEGDGGGGVKSSMAWAKTYACISQKQAARPKVW